MFRLKLFALMLLMATPAFAGNQLARYLDPVSVSMGSMPERGEDYDLGALRIFQKLEGGYLIMVDSRYVPGNTIGLTAAFLMTNKKYEEDESLNGKKATFIGYFTYQSLNGFDQRVYKLKEVE